MKSQVLSEISLGHQIRQLEQVCQEDRHNPKNLREKLLKSLNTTDDLEVHLAINAMEMMILMQTVEDHYASKKKRYEQLTQKPADIAKEIVLITLYCREWTPIQQPAGQLGAFLGYDDPFDGVKTASELLAITCNADLFDIARNKSKELVIKSNIVIDAELLEYADSMHYMPPSLVPPRPVYKTHHNGYKTTTGSLLLGRDNHHNEPLAFDALNLAAKVPLSLDTEALSEPEAIADDIINAQHKALHHAFINQAKQVYKDILDAGNEFYFTWKFDKRGRMYSQGYHINIQSTEYRKAMINLANKEIIR